MSNRAEKQKFYSSQLWSKCRNEFYKYKGGLCEECLKKGIYTAGVIVHHKEHITVQNLQDPEIALNFDNLQLLCRECHAKAHSRKRYRVDEMGRVIF